MNEITKKTEWDLDPSALILWIWALAVLFTDFLNFGYFPYADTFFKVIAVIVLLTLSLHKK